MSQNARQHDKDQNVAVIVKAPLIAMKYPIAEGQVIAPVIPPPGTHNLQVRRFQIRFASEENYYDAMKMLSRFQVPTIEAGTFPHRPQTAGPAISKAVEQPVSAGPLSTRPFTAVRAISLTDSRQIASATLKPVFVEAAKLSAPQLHTGQVDNSIATSCQELSRAPVVEVSPSTPHTHFSGASAESQPPAAISLYTPRPSVAPSLESQHVSQMLPPRRELPFEKSKAVERPVSARVLRSASQPSPSPERGTSKEAEEQAQKQQARKTNTTDSHLPGAKRNRSPAKKSAEETKPKQAAKRARQSRAKKADDPTTDLPSIQDVLEKSVGTDRGLPNTSKALDTQALLTRADALNRPKQSRSPDKVDIPMQEHAGGARKLGNINPVDKPVTEAHSLQVEVPASSAPAVPEPSVSAPAPLLSPLKSAATAYPCTPANQMLSPNPTTPVAPTVQHTMNAATATAPLIPDTTPMTSPAYVALLKHPLFTPPNSDSNGTHGLEGWSSLPASDQQTALQTWICEQYEDKEANAPFLQLCKTLGEMWETSVVWPDVYKETRNMGGDGEF